jgi:hypothetical protein
MCMLILVDASTVPILTHPAGMPSLDSCQTRGNIASLTDARAMNAGMKAAVVTMSVKNLRWFGELVPPSELTLCYMRKVSFGVNMPWQPWIEMTTSAVLTYYGSKYGEPIK